MNFILSQLQSSYLSDGFDEQIRNPARLLAHRASHPPTSITDRRQNVPLNHLRHRCEDPPTMDGWMEGRKLKPLNTKCTGFISSRSLSAFSPSSGREGKDRFARLDRWTTRFLATWAREWMRWTITGKLMIAIVVGLLRVGPWLRSERGIIGAGLSRCSTCRQDCLVEFPTCSVS